MAHINSPDAVTAAVSTRMNILSTSDTTALVPLTEEQLAAIEGGTYACFPDPDNPYPGPWGPDNPYPDPWGPYDPYPEPDYTDYTAHGINLSSEYPDADPDELAAIGRSMVGRF